MRSCSTPSIRFDLAVVPEPMVWIFSVAEPHMPCVIEQKVAAWGRMRLVRVTGQGWGSCKGRLLYGPISAPSGGLL